MKYDFYQMHLIFQNFMIQKGYKPRERESLLSPIFKKTFTMSGGPDLAYKFRAGDNNLKGSHIVNQPCIRHRDIDLTGDNKHLSFFNMFVADSIEGFSREQVIGDFFEFFTVCLELDPNKFYASYFSGGNIHGTNFPPDNEMKKIRMSIGIPESKIIPFGDEYGMEAFVANTVEPVGGPRSELFYDLREDYNENLTFEEFMRHEKNGDIVEFFTHVLYNIEVKYEEKEEEFEFVEMAKKSAVAAGFGPQRISRIQEGVNHIGDISVLKGLKSFIGNTPIKETTIVADHIRGIIFLIHDGILNLHGKDNRSRRYIFRKYVKHLKENFDLLHIDNKEDILKKLAMESIDLFSILFPDFKKDKGGILTKFIDLYNKIDNEDE